MYSKYKAHVLLPEENADSVCPRFFYQQRMLFFGAKVLILQCDIAINFSFFTFHFSFHI